MQKEDLKQISDLLDEKFDQKLKENNKNLVTKDDLKEAFEKNNIVLKKDIIDEMSRIMCFTISESEKSMKGLIKELEENINKQITASHEEIMTIIKTIKEEQTANIGAHDRIEKNIKNHEIRIKELEVKPV